MTRYRPEEIKFSNAKTAIGAGREQIPQNGDMLMDISALADGNTVAVCALLEWKRRAAEINCRLQFENIPPRLKELIAVYQLESLLLNSETAAK